MATMEQTTDTRLKRGISGPPLYLFILGDVLGAGVYALVGVISAEVGGAAAFTGRAFRKPFISFLVGFCMLAAGVTIAPGLAHGDISRVNSHRGSAQRPPSSRLR